MTLDLTHWGLHAAAAFRARGVDTIFTLTGGHIFLLYDGARQAGIRLVDVRHEQTAAFAAEAYARLTRGPGVAAVTAGPGVFNAASAFATAARNGSALVLLGGRAPGWRWGRGSLQEIDHVPVLAPLAKRAFTAGPALIRELSRGIREALTPPRGPLFLDVPLDLEPAGVEDDADRAPPGRLAPDPDAVARIAGAIGAARRPVLVAGSNVWADGAAESLRAFAEASGIPVFANGMGRGTLPHDHPSSFLRSRGKALREADLVFVAGTPIDFRLGFGDGWASGAKIIHADSDPALLSAAPAPFASAGADLDLVFRGLAERAKESPSADWLEALRLEERRLEESVAAERASASEPIHPLRVYGELARVLDRDAIVIGDGGDFVSWAGREIRSSVPGSWLDPGPLGCLGLGPGAAMAARLVHPGRQVVVLTGDGAFGFAGFDLESLVRNKLPVVFVMGNNGTWALEKQAMRRYFAYDVVADLDPRTRYDRVVQALGGHGERVTRPDEVGPALRRAFAAGVPALVEVMIDPAVVYPRHAELA
ncbi:MAG: acetolactate synthase [Deltaproteobacteria bacterium]|nr:acetolactate synthase [Deltaproteobacteria bacterium]